MSSIQRITALGTDKGLSIEFSECPPAHVGFGSTTSAVLAGVAAASRELGLELRPAELVGFSRRGGASGIGIHAFFRGGFVADAGHPTATLGGFLPSDATRPGRPPEALAQLTVPPSWRFLLFLPEGDRIDGQAEVEFFQQACPIPRLDALTSIAFGYHGVAAGVARRDLRAVAEGLRALHRWGFKKIEMDRQPKAAALVAELAAVDGVACGMSSLGPLVYAIVPEDQPDLQAAVLHGAATRHVPLLGESKPGWGMDIEEVRLA